MSKKLKFVCPKFGASVFVSDGTVVVLSMSGLGSGVSKCVEWDAGCRLCAFKKDDKPQEAKETRELME